MTVSPVACCAPIAKQPLEESEAVELAALLKAVADPVRLRLLSMIGSHPDGEACVCDLTGAFDLSAPTISHHLKILRNAGLIDGERRGTWVYYWIVPAQVARLGELFSPMSEPTSTA
ncbi:MAG TPA: metalloregulator ArsR/SmtB family transcription factor [Nonomuraea sp.]|uniref:metalloregulator ArsR/SmtB family transcription factor n=1 Tax=Nonomuraea sp. NPDC049649 TaxID=3155776 RepID=UPI002CD8875C|nr:metalloregulator ArsR/SmtB family transcription factor [Nonomuraea sp.]